MFEKQEERNQIVAGPSQKQEGVNMSVACPRKLKKEEKRLKTPQLEENKEERTQSVAQLSQSFQRPKNASQNRKTESKIARTPQKRTFSLPKQILSKPTRKNVSGGKISSPLKLRNEKIKRVADIRAYFEAKIPRSPSFKGGGGGGITKQANSLEVRKPLVENHRTSKENSLELANLHLAIRPKNTLNQPQISLPNGHHTGELNHQPAAQDTRPKKGGINEGK